MREDHRLLDEFCRNGSEGAFREVVDRHLKLVYSAAMRIVNGDAHLAQDISQLVFSNLARKAPSLPAGVVLAGWLHRDARFTALAVLRKERRRVEREQEAVKMNELERAGQETDWAALRPMLDEILVELNEEDRHALLLRFFEQQSLAEVGTALGLAEDAARKRVARALEKLREMLASRGITTTLAALSVLLAAHAAENVPAGLDATLTRTALAGAAATTASTMGIFSLITSAKAVTLVATLAVVLLVGGAIVTIFKSGSNGVPAAVPAVSVVGSDTNRTSPQRAAPANPAGDAITGAFLDAALHKVEEALHDPNPTTNFPNSAMEAAIDQLSGRKAAANPLLEAALKEPEQMVRMRAVDGLGLIGKEAKEATPLLLGMLEAGGLSGDIRWTVYKAGNGMMIGIEPGNLTLYALGQIGAAPEILPAVAQMVKDKPSALHTITQGLKSSSSDRHLMLGANWLLACADGNPTALNDAFRPLLQDEKPEIRRTAASCLANALGTNADAGVFPVAIELLMSGDDNTLRLEGLRLLAQATDDQSRFASDGQSVKSSLAVTRLGGALSETVTALTEVATNTVREDLRSEAWRLLDILNPDFRKDSPEIAAAMAYVEQLAAFKFKAQSGQATMPEMLEGIKQFPKAAPVVAAALVNRGADARVALPALSEAMSSLAPLPDASGPDRSAAIRAREQLANAMQKLAPDQPKPIFTETDVESVMRILLDPAVRADANRRSRISAARKTAEWPVQGPFDVSPEQMRRLLSALKEADAAIYDTVTARVKEIDPLFH